MISFPRFLLANEFPKRSWALGLWRVRFGLPLHSLTKYVQDELSIGQEVHVTVVSTDSPGLDTATCNAALQ